MEGLSGYALRVLGIAILPDTTTYLLMAFLPNLMVFTVETEFNKYRITSKVTAIGHSASFTSSVRREASGENSYYLFQVTSFGLTPYDLRLATQYSFVLRYVGFVERLYVTGLP